MSLRGKKLGLLLSISPDHPNFDHGLRLAAAALDEGADVYLYCIDDAVHGLTEPRLQRLKSGGAKLFACAFGAQCRELPMTDCAVYGGLTILSDIIASTDRFVSFN